MRLQLCATGLPTHPESERLPNCVFELSGCFRVFAEELTCILASLTDPFACKAEPRSALFEDIMSRSEIDEIGFV